MGNDHIEDLALVALVDRINNDVDASVALEDVAPVEIWLRILKTGAGGRLADTIIKGSFDLLEHRYPRALPFPFDRLSTVPEISPPTGFEN